MRPIPKRAALVLALSSVALPSRPAAADGWENVPTGSRTAAMGGAALATGRDAAMPTVNPAGIGLVPATTLSLSASLYHLGVVTVPHYFADAGTLDEATYGRLQVSQQGVGSQEYSSVPSSMAFFYVPESRTYAVAAALSMPRDIQRRFVEQADFTGNGLADRERATTLYDERQYQAAVSFAQNLGPRLRWGASVVVGATLHTESVAGSSLFVGGNNGFGRVDRSSSVQGRSVDGTAVVGVQAGSVDDGLAFGLAVRAPSVHLDGKLTSSDDFLTAGTYLTASSELLTVKGDFRSQLPLRIGAGLAYTVRERFGVALDVTAYLPRSSEVRWSGESTYSIVGGEGAGLAASSTQSYERDVPTARAINVAMGLEVRVGEDRWLRLGLFNDASYLAAPVKGQEEPFSFPFSSYGASLGLGTILGPVDTTVGLRGSYGSGKTGRYVPSQRFTDYQAVETTSASAWDFMAFVSAAIDSAADRKAAERLLGREDKK